MIRSSSKPAALSEPIDRKPIGLGYVKIEKIIVKLDLEMGF
jgi:hypothetical protein